MRCASLGAGGRQLLIGSLKSGLLVLVASAAALSAAAHPKCVKYIVSGFEWGRLTPAQILANAERLDKLPIDGVTVYVHRDLPDGTRLTRDRLWSDANWSRENVAPFVSGLRKFRGHRALRESLLTFRGTSTNRLAWTDDAAWARAGDNLAVLAWLAKAGGLKGLAGDFEEYHKLGQYKYKPKEDPPYPESARLARRRGREVFGKAFAAYPEMTVLFYQLFTQHAGYQGCRDVEARAREWKDLWPSFCVGIVEAATPQAKLVDGDETTGYLCEAATGDFYRQAAYQATGVLGFLPPDLRAKYRAQLSVSFGLFIDEYTISDTKSCWYRGPVEGSRLTHFERNLAQACEAADEYVWIWAQDGKWVDWPQVRSRELEGYRRWEEQLPGVEAMLVRARDPNRATEQLMERMKANGAFRNLVTSETKTGAWLTVRNVKAGERYGVVVSAKGPGAIPQVVWRKGGEWNWNLPRAVPESTLPDEDGQCRLCTVATVPDGADELVLQLNARIGPDERLEYSDVNVFKIEER